MSGSDGKVVVPPDSSGKAIDTSELIRSDGTVVERQRIVIADPYDPTSTWSLDRLKQKQQMQEVAELQAVEASANTLIYRAHERPLTIDRRGIGVGRGAVR